MESLSGDVPSEGPVVGAVGTLPLNRLVHPSQSRYTGTLANFVAGYLERTAGDHRCHAVNRLDRDTSGLIIAAKNDAAHLSLSAQLAALAEEMPGSHIHYDAYNSLSEDSAELIIERI